MSDDLYISQPLTARGGFTAGIEGPACDRDGNIYAVNYARQGTIGKVTPTGQCEVFVQLPEGSIGNGIRFNRAGEMLIADYTNHNILKVAMETRAISVYAHEPTAHQPNDLCITDDDLIFCSDPNWQRGDGQFVPLQSTLETLLRFRYTEAQQTISANNQQYVKLVVNRCKDDDFND